MKLKSSALALALAVLGYMGSAVAQSYTFETVNYPDDTFTQLLGINNAGIIAGYHGFNPNKGFTYNPSSKVFTSENYTKSAQTQVIGINNLGKTVGFYVTTGGLTSGFQFNGTTFFNSSLPGTPFNQLLSQNDHAQAAGYYSTKADGSGPDHAYILDEQGTVYEVLTIPGSTSAQATGINNSSQVCGFTIDSASVSHGWLLNQGYYTQLDYPSSTIQSTMALGLNNKGIVVGTYTDGSGTHGFTYNMNTKKWVSVDDPSGVGTTIVNGLNDNGVLVGFYGPADATIGFIATPVAP